MRQKVVIRAKISRKDRVLLLRRHGGRGDIAGRYELPGGSLHSGEQPLDALKRSLAVHSALEPESAKLQETVSFVDPVDHDLQYLFIVYRVSIDDTSRIILDDEYDHYVWRKLSETDPDTVTESTAILLNLASLNPVAKAADHKNTDIDVAKNTTIIIHSDGGSRGNPGPTASAYIIENSGGEILDQGGEYLGDFLTNDVAEYYGVLLGLRAAADIGARNVSFYSDSLMVVDQLNGMFHVKELDRKIYDEIKYLVHRFDHVGFHHVHREYNRSADALVNQILDKFAPKNRNHHEYRDS